MTSCLWGPRVVIGTLVFNLAWTCSVPATAQDGVPAAPTLRVRADLVVLHVGVTNDDGVPVDGLPCEAFHVYEENRLQDLSLCQPGQVPMALGLVIDSSTSMGRYREFLAAAGEAFVRLGPRDSDVFVLRFNEHVRPGLTGVAFTREPEVVAQALQQLRPRGLTALHDAIIEAIAWAGRSPHQKRAIVLVSDGGDNASAASFDEALAAALTSDVTVFSVAVDHPMDSDADPAKLERLARATGGLVFRPHRPADLTRAFERLAADLRQGYTLAFASNREYRPGEYRRLRVTVGQDGRPLRVRARAGYTTAGSTP